jgi:hypothetical protein
LYGKNVRFCHVISMRYPSTILPSGFSSQMVTCIMPSDGSFRDVLPSNSKSDPTFVAGI